MFQWTFISIFSDTNVSGQVFSLLGLDRVFDVTLHRS